MISVTTGASGGGNQSLFYPHAVDSRAAAGCYASVSSTSNQPGILFTAFEPSGDRLAAPVISHLRTQLPEVPVYAWGGERMEAAGARLLENTCRESDMLVPALSVIREHLAVRRRIADFLKTTDILLHVPVDAPAANFPICRLSRKKGCTIVHLVAPQLWAWAEGRIRKLRRLTDLVLCLLPFEEQWFKERGVPAVYIGHPLFESTPEQDGRPVALPRGGPRLALLPGSRPAEIRNNFPLMVRSFLELRIRHRGLTAVAVAADEAVAQRLADMAKDTPDDLVIVTDSLEHVLDWCDLALATSGTVTLQVARSGKPMIVVYRLKRGLSWLLYRTIGPFLMTSKYFALPNVLAGERIVEEFAPHFGGHSRVTKTVGRYLDDTRLGAAQSAKLREVIQPFLDRNASQSGAAEIIRMYQRHREAREAEK